MLNLNGCNKRILTTIIIPIMIFVFFVTTTVESASPTSPAFGQNARVTMMGWREKEFKRFKDAVDILDWIPQFSSLDELDDALVYARTQIQQRNFLNIESGLKKLLEELVSPYLTGGQFEFRDQLEKMGLLNHPDIFYEKISEVIHLLYQGGISSYDLLKKLPGREREKRDLFQLFCSYELKRFISVESIEKERLLLLQIAKDAYSFNRLIEALKIYLMIGKEKDAEDILAQVSPEDIRTDADFNILPEYLRDAVITYFHDFNKRYNYELLEAGYPILLSLLPQG